MNFLFTESARGVRIHKATCKRATGGLPVDRMSPRAIAVAKPATCCRPKGVSDLSLYGDELLVDLAHTEVEEPLSPTCPRCGDKTIDTLRPAVNALSRKDNRTYVCGACGTDEAMMQMRSGRDADIWPNYPGVMSHDPATLELYEITVSFADSGVSKHYWKSFGVDGGRLVAEGIGVELSSSNSKDLSFILTGATPEMLIDASSQIEDMWSQGFEAFKTWRKTDEVYKNLPPQTFKWVTSDRYAAEQAWLRDFARNWAKGLPLGDLL